MSASHRIQSKRAAITVHIICLVTKNPWITYISKPSSKWISELCYTEVLKLSICNMIHMIREKALKDTSDLRTWTCTKGSMCEFGRGRREENADISRGSEKMCSNCKNKGKYIHPLELTSLKKTRWIYFISGTAVIKGKCLSKGICPIPKQRANSVTAS